MPYDTQPHARLLLRKLDMAGASDDLTLEAQFNPAYLDLDLNVTYQRQGIKGMSHKLMQFENTENQGVPLELFWRVSSGTATSANQTAADLANLSVIPERDQNAALDRLSRLGQPVSRPLTVEHMRRAERFILSLCYPRRGGSTITGSAPPRVLVVWPTFLSLVCVVTAARFRFTRFNTDVEPVQAMANLQLEEIRDARLTSEDAYERGWLRAEQGGSR